LSSGIPGTSLIDEIASCAALHMMRVQESGMMKVFEDVKKLDSEVKKIVADIQHTYGLVIK